MNFIKDVLAAPIQPPAGQGPTVPLGNIGEGGGLGPFANIFGINTAMEKFASGFSAIVGFLTVVGGLWFIIQLIIGALQWVGSGGDKASLQGAQQKITNALVGLIIVVAAVTIIKVIGIFLDFDLLNPASFIEAIRFK